MRRFAWLLWMHTLDAVIRRLEWLEHLDQGDRP